MRRICMLIVMALLGTTICFSQIFEGTAKTLRIRFMEDNKWSEWSQPEKVNIRVLFDTEQKRLTIYSGKTQIYKILDASEPYCDYTKGVKSRYYTFSVIDQDGDYAEIIMRKGDDWMQIYVQFADVEWIYYME